MINKATNNHPAANTAFPTSVHTTTAEQHSCGPHTTAPKAESSCQSCTHTTTCWLTREMHNISQKLLWIYSTWPVDKLHAIRPLTSPALQDYSTSWTDLLHFSKTISIFIWFFLFITLRNLTCSSSQRRVTWHPSTSWTDGWEKADLCLREWHRVFTELDLHLVFKSGNSNHATLQCCQIKAHSIFKWFQKVTTEESIAGNH